MVLGQYLFPCIAHYPDADVLTSIDEIIPTVIDDSLETWQQGGDGCCPVKKSNFHPSKKTLLCTRKLQKKCATSCAMLVHPKKIGTKRV
ncbi:hypothetical protein QN277_016759 [Acacia crassicarpa]|uniref:Uncharacterized protein n=1 Tax=Acacia crassicarpa TaxID=499986 RepID=A0AAE1MXB0_9FABA|nr:hypothetical protein QN277_016759 [Acacia crassicarpa]